MRDFTQRRARVRRVGLALTLAAAVSTMTAAPVIAATTGLPIHGVYNARDASLVPFSFFDTTLEVASDASYPPDEWMQGTTMVGLDVDMMRAVATTLGFKFHENNVAFDGIIGGIRANDYQIGNSSFPDTKALETQANFVDYFRAGQAVYATTYSSATFEGLASLCGLEVGVVRGSAEQSVADVEVAKCPSSEALSVHAFANATQLDDAILAGQVSEGFIDSQEAGYLVSKAAGVLKLVGQSIDVETYGIATAKTPAGEQLARAIRAALRTLENNGTYQAILTKWGASDGAMPLGLIALNGASF